MQKIKPTKYKRICSERALKLILTIFIVGLIFITIIPSFSNSTTFKMEWNKTLIPPETWVKINLHSFYEKPIVVVTPEYNHTIQDYGISTWVTNVTNTSFLVRASNQNLNATTNIYINYLVTEEGNWTLPGTNLIMEAGKVSTNKYGSQGAGNWGCPDHGVTVYFNPKFNSKNPLLLSTRGSDNNPTIWATTFQDNYTDETQPLTNLGMCIGLSQSRSTNIQAIPNNETIYWIGVDEGNGTLPPNYDFETLWNLQDTGDSGGSWINGYRDGPPFYQHWNHNWDTAPKVIVVSQTSVAGSDGSWPILYKILDIKQIDMFVDEANERSHTGSESGGGWAFSKPGYFILSAPKISNPKFNESLINRFEKVLFNVTINEYNLNDTILNATTSILYPNGTLKNFSLHQNSFNQTLYTNDLESGTETAKGEIGITPWLIGWKYRQEYCIEGSPIEDVYNYTIPLYLYPGFGVSDGNKIYLNNHANLNYSDIRFTNSSSNLLNYWEERNYGKYAIFWVKIPYIPKATNKTCIFIYYGNKSGRSLSNGYKTFLFFEDFENYGSTADGSTPPTWTNFNSGKVVLDTLSGDRVLKKTANNDPNGGYTYLGRTLHSFELMLFTDRINNNGGSQNRYGMEDNSSDGYGPRMYGFSGSSKEVAIEKRKGGTSDGNLVYDYFVGYQNAWYKVMFSYFNQSLNFSLYNSSNTQLFDINTTNSQYTSFTRVYVHGGYEFLTDNISVRNYISPEPSPFNNSGEETEGNDNDTNKTIVIYNNIFPNKELNNINKIFIKLNVVNYNNSGTQFNGNREPDLEFILRLDNKVYLSIGKFNISGKGMYEINITNKTICSEFESAKERDILIKPIYFDYYDASHYDNISWDYINLSVIENKKSSTWFMIFNDTNLSGRYNATEVCAFDKFNQHNCTFYTNVSFNVSKIPEIELFTPLNNSKLIEYNYTTFKFEVTHSQTDTNNCSLYLNGIKNKTVECDLGKNTTINLTLDRGIYNWFIKVDDIYGNEKNSSTWNFLNILYNDNLISKTITFQNTNIYLINISYKDFTNINITKRFILDFNQNKSYANSFIPNYNWTDTINGPLYYGNIYGWNISQQNKTYNIKYLIYSTNNLFGLLNNFMIGD